MNEQEFERLWQAAEAENYAQQLRDEYPRWQARRRRNMGVAALLIVGGTALYHYQSENECVAYIYGERVTDREVVLGEMQKTMTAMTADGSDVVEEQLKALFGND